MAKTCSDAVLSNLRNGTWSSNVISNHLRSVNSQSSFPSPDATFFDDVVDGCGFEIIKLGALKKAHKDGEDRHRSELCTLYLRENTDQFDLMKVEAPLHFNRKDLRLTVDNPEDLILCKAVYKNFIEMAPKIPLDKIIEFLDMNPELIELTKSLTEVGYESMYIWRDDEKK